MRDDPPPDAEDAGSDTDPLAQLFDLLALLKVAPTDALVADTLRTIFAADTLKAIAGLKRDSPAGYARLHGELKLFKSAHPNSGFTFESFKDQLKKFDSATVPGSEPDVTTQLIDLSLSAQHFLDVNTGEIYADFSVEADGVTYPMTGAINGQPYQRWLTMCFYETTKRAPPREPFKSALRTIEARAFASRRSFRLFPRICQMIEDDDPVIYLDRGSDAWDAFRIDHNGVKLVTAVPVKFVRPESGIAELPMPDWGGNIDDLEKLVNLRSRRDFILGIGWVLSCFQPANALPQVLLLGQHGTAKTTGMKRFCALVDPILNDPLGPPSLVDDMMISAQTTYVQAFDNVKRIGEEMSAAYCRLSTGGGLRKRVLYTDKGLLSIWARRPLIQTSTRMVVKEPDLADRTIQVLSGAPFRDGQEDSYRPDDEVDDEFIAAWPKLFGAILTAVVEGLRHRKAGEPVPKRGIPRMASFAVWSYRCEAGLGWERGIILNAYREAIRDFAQDIVEMDPVASAIMMFMLDPDRIDAGWEGSATLLLAYLNHQDSGRGQRSRDWPRDARDLSTQLSELTGVLRANQLHVAWGRNEADRRRSIAMTWLAKPDGAAKPTHQAKTPPEDDPLESWRPVAGASR
jgi:hypothetical protein